MDNNLLNQLLNENESFYLDFKQEQYKFAGATDTEKRELLKDILAFTNSWRRTDAYILIGVKEQIGERSIVLGINEHIQDHSLQQFINSKTQEPITFSYIPYEYNGKQIGIIWIPVQKRPIYLVSNYGRLEKNVVYIRRGSSTDEATPDEISKMGLAMLQEINQLSLDLQFADIKRNEFLGQSIDIASTVLEIPNRNNIPDFDPNRSNPLNPWESSISLSQPIRSYFRDLVDYYETNLLVKPISFAVKNLGQITAQNVRLIISQENSSEIKIFDDDSLPSEPLAYFNITMPIQDVPITSIYKSNLELKCFSNKLILEINFGNIQPKADAWADEVVYIGCQENKGIRLDCQIYADNLPDPISVPLNISFVTASLESDIKTIQEVIKKQREKMLDDLFDD
jgi:hypothetical protein